MPEDSRRIIIDNLGEIQGLHECKSTDKLERILVSIARMEQAQIGQAACFQELSARFEEQVKQIQQVLHSPHICTSKDEIIELKAAVAFLKEEHHKRSGQSKWEDRIWNIGQAVLIAAMVALVLFFMKGGAIT